MRPILLATLLNLGLTTSVQIAIAQSAPPNPPTGQVRLISGLPMESVTVIATRPSEESIKSFVETRIAPTRFLGKMARWRRQICPLTIGLGDKYAKFVSQRIRDIATAVGAPVNADPVCRPNIEVFFTTTPQVLLDNIRKTGPAFLGYYSNSSQADELAKVNHPIQAWYTTESLDYDGTSQIDMGPCNRGPTVNTLAIGVDAAGSPIEITLPCTTIVHASGSRLGNGLDSGFNNILIVAEPAKLFDFEVGSLADYITMLVLSQPASLDSCQELPSISNLLAKGCASASSKITDGDLAYLRGLYRMPSGYSLNAQHNEILYEMKKTLVTDKDR
jgi:hypothetical protein